MTNTYVKRVMIDTGSSTDILYFDAFQRLGLADRDLTAITSTLTGFTGDSVSPLGADAFTRLASSRVTNTPSGRMVRTIGPSVSSTVLASNQQLRENLDLLEEKRVDGHLRALAYRRAVTKLYNCRVRHRYVEMGDLVLQKTEVSDPTQSRGKLAPNWEGPYRVVDVIQDGTYTLATMEGRVLPRT
ncbi:hypothetical protein BHM03_00058786 [Ensete ventricosum]|nr:hypothetical protein BHM03_00058786 [Ensete ventricosum]